VNEVRTLESLLVIGLVDDGCDGLCLMPMDAAV
jgi:hypothetical protein